jgi:hypothetical protein
MQLVPLHFALWAGYEERAREGEKYVLGERTQRQHARGKVGVNPEEVRAARAAARAAAAGADDGGGGGGDGAPALEW